MTELDIMKWINNVYYILKQQNVKITDFEKRTKITQGYLSKIKSGKTKPLATKFVSICNGCNVDINTLIKEDFTKLPKATYIILKSLNTLLNKVDSDDWCSCSASDLEIDVVLSDVYELYLNTLFRERISEDGQKSYSYNSIIFPNEICPTQKPAYYLYLTEYKLLTIICFDIHDKEHYEVSIIENGHINKVCSSIDSIYSSTLTKLYREITQKLDDSKISQHTLNDLITLIKA